MGEGWQEGVNGWGRRGARTSRASLRLRMEGGGPGEGLRGYVGCVEGSRKVAVGVCRLINSCIFFFSVVDCESTSALKKGRGGKKNSLLIPQPPNGNINILISCAWQRA